MDKLWHYRLCPHSRAIRLALAEVGMAVSGQEERPWEWRQAFLAINASGELPVLDAADGPMVAGHYAISEYLAEIAPTDSTPLPTGLPAMRLFPGNAEKRAETRRLTDWFGAKLHREVTRDLLIERVYGQLASTGATHRPDEAILAACRANLPNHLNYIGFLAYQRRWLAGDSISYADLTAAAQLSVLDYLGEISWAECPKVKDWYARLKARPSMRPLLADRVQGLPPPLHYTNLDF